MSSHLRPLLSSAVLLGLIGTAACVQAPPGEQEAQANPLEGVWSLTASDPGDGSPAIDPSQPGLYVFAEGHYSAVYAPGAEPRIPSETSFQPTAEEMVAQHESIIVNAGSYTISGSTVTFHPIIAKSPGFVGGHATSEYRVDGDLLTLSWQTIIGEDGTSAPNVGGSLTLRRVE
jgi:hypothetical protein